MPVDDFISGLPGEELMREGLSDYRSGRCTVASCLIAIARSRLTDAGLLSKNSDVLLAEPERQLYRLLRQQDGDAYSRYNALVRELVSFEQSLDHRRRIMDL